MENDSNVTEGVKEGYVVKETYRQGRDRSYLRYQDIDLVITPRGTRG